MLLRISVTFHEPGYGGLLGRGEAEWPPSPWRLFCALLAGSKIASRGRPWRSADVYEWLECQPPPAIIAPRVRRGQPYCTFVPSDDGDTAARALARGRQPDPEDTDAARRSERSTVITHILDDPPTVHYLWRIVRGDAPIARRVIDEAQHLLVLGRGVDEAFATGAVEEDDVPHPGLRWWPCIHYPGTVRVPRPGALRELEEIHERSTRRVSGRAVDLVDRPRPDVWQRVYYASESSRLPRPYAAFYLRPPPGYESNYELYWSWRSTQATGLAAAVRTLVAQAAQEEGRPDRWIREYVLGHVPTGVYDRLSYYCLPTTGEPYADGRIRRVMVVEPWGGSGVHADWVRDKLDGREIVGENGLTGGMLVAAREDRPFDGIFGLYGCRRASRVWASVTPVLFRGDREARGPDVLAEQIQQVLAQAGLPRAARWRVLSGSRWRGIWGSCRLPAYLRRRLQAHVEIEFDDPMPGPFAIGDGQHVGLGIMAGCDDTPLPV